MATQSVTIPGLEDLLRNTMQFADPKLAQQAAENVRLPLTYGIAAIGNLLWWAAQHEDFGHSSECRKTIADIGILFKEASETIEIMQLIKTNAAFQQNEPKASESAFVEIPVVGVANAHEVQP